MKEGQSRALFLFRGKDEVGTKLGEKMELALRYMVEFQAHLHFSRNPWTCWAGWKYHVGLDGEML